MLRNKLSKIGTGLVFSFSLAGMALAQTPSPTPFPSPMTSPTPFPTPSESPTPFPSPSTMEMSTPTTSTKTTTTTMKTEVVQNPDGSYSVIEYPINKEVIVDLTPMTSMRGAKGLARVMRTDNETTVNFDLSGVGETASSYYAYTVDPAGAVTYLGPITSEKGLAKASFKTPLNQFMIVLSPNEGLTTFANDTPVIFRSSVPKGYAVVNNRVTSPVSGDEKQVAGTQTVSSTYDVPLLGVSGFEKGETEIRVNFSGDLEGLKGKAYLDNSKAGLTKIKMRFDDMKMAPKQKRYVLWAVSAAKEYTKIGQVINNGNRAEAEIRGETALKDFGLFVTVEDKDVLQPSGKTYSTFSINP